jgi:hypothetical protein
MPKLPTWFVCLWPGGDETIPWGGPFGIVRFQLMSYTPDMRRPIPLMYKDVLWEVTTPHGTTTRWEKTDDNGWTDYPFYYDAPGDWTYKVTFQGDDEHAACTAKVTITVLPPPSPPTPPPPTPPKAKVRTPVMVYVQSPITFGLALLIASQKR